MTSLRFIDTFAGIGGFRVAAEALGMTCVASIEWDKECQKTYKENFGDAPLGDITTINPGDLPEHDILFGGFPCQPFSRNGKYNHNSGTIAAGDTRQDLYKSLISILSCHRPKFFLFENVKELLTIRDGNNNLFIDSILSDMDDNGYNVSHKVINARDFGLPQQRNRVYFVGVRKDIDVKFVFPAGVAKGSYIKDILDPVVDAKYNLTERWAGRTLLIQRPDRVNHTRAVGSPRLDALEEIYAAGLATPSSRKPDIIPLAIIYGDTPSGLPRQQDKLYSIEGVSPTLATFELTVPAFAVGGGKNDWRVLTPSECGRVQGFPSNYKFSNIDATTYKQLGNAVSPPVIKHILQALLDGAKVF